MKRDFQHATKATGYSELRDYQRKIIQEYLSCIDLFVSAPTRAGKSLTFELVPYAFGRLLGEDCNVIVFVMVPLISITKDLVSSRNCRGIRASYVGDNTFKILSINWCLEVRRRFSTTIDTFFVEWNKTIKNARVFIDESHFIAKWSA